MAQTRRDFITSSALASAGLLLSNTASAFHAITDPGEKWYLKMRRVAQHNLNEYDPKNLDIDKWVDYWASLKLNAIIITAGGFIAMYPTKLPHHYKSQFLGNRDVFGDYLKALKKKGIKVIARIETNFLHKDIYAQRPEWVEKNEDGSPREHSETPWIYRTCLFSNYRNEQVPKIMNEIMANYDVDGFFTNSWPQVELPPHVCHCESCKRLGNLSTKEVSEIAMTRTLETINLLNSTVRKKGQKIVYNVNIAGGIGAIQDLQQVGNLADWITTDHQGRGGGTPIWDCAQQGKVAYAVMKGRPVTNVVGTKTGPWRHSSNSEAETNLWLAQTTSSGMIPWLVWLGSDLPDNRWQEIGRKYYQWLEKNEKHFFNKKPMARLGVVFSNKVNELYKAPGRVPGGYWGDPVNPNERGNSTDYLQGIYYALLEGRFVFDFIHVNDLTPEGLKNYNALILPNIALLSNEQANNLKSFVNRGGSLLATFETGMYDEWGKPRNDFALSDIFDVHLKSDYKGPRGQVFYTKINDKHEIFREFEMLEQLPGGEFYVPIKASGRHVLDIVPPFPNGIPEMVYPYPRKEIDSSGQETDNPAIVVREKGNSRLVYFPTDIDKNVWTRGSTDLSRIIQNSVRWMMKDKINISVEGEGYVEVFAWETEPGFALHILNYNNPNMTRASIRKVYPIGEQRVRMQLPNGVKISRAQLLRSGKPLSIRQNGNIVEFIIPSIGDFEIAALYK
ncbi:alpha-amylase family protein [Terrimonas alba]|uniref:alpha-amylase family protein n=1 Tax=Terrimonas alba TaxID=3349636 RepID=UPI0035F442F8